jgi:hypothetical protein
MVTLSEGNDNYFELEPGYIKSKTSEGFHWNYETRFFKTAVRLGIEELQNKDKKYTFTLLLLYILKELKKDKEFEIRSIEIKFTFDKYEMFRLSTQNYSFFEEAVMAEYENYLNDVETDLLLDYKKIYSDYGLNIASSYFKFMRDLSRSKC